MLNRREEFDPNDPQTAREVARLGRALANAALSLQASGVIQMPRQFDLTNVKVLEESFVYGIVEFLSEISKE